MTRKRCVCWARWDCCRLTWDTRLSQLLILTVELSEDVSMTVVRDGMCEGILFWNYGYSDWLFGWPPFCLTGHLYCWPFIRIVICPTGFLSNVPLVPLDICTTGHLSEWPFFRLALCTTGHLVDLPFSLPALAASTLHGCNVALI